ETVDGPALTGTNRAQATSKRFWKTVGIETHTDHFRVTLDNRGLKTPDGNPLAIPRSKRLLATLIADEWENQEKLIKPHALPLTSLASRVIDGMNNAETRAGVEAALLKYLDTDTVCFHETAPLALVELQHKHWDPLLEWARAEYKAEIRVFDSLLINTQPKATRDVFARALKGLDNWQLAAMERAVYTTKSFIIALALIQGRISVEEASEASHVEVNSQIRKWGEVEDSHDVDHRDVRRLLGSVACVLSNM
ncbi:hypothetical protein BOTBODRAFT_81258, partial [Botryobasidium botryosum FD-172 SS1]